MIPWGDFSAVLFDLDGTLVDSMGMWRRVDDVYLGKRGIPVPDDLQKSLEKYSHLQTAYYFKDRFALPDTIDEILREWHVLASREYRTNVPLKEGADVFVKYLKERGCLTAIASSSSKDLIRDAVDAHGLLPYFDLILSCDEVSVNKPDPAVYLACAERLGADPSSCLVFEDLLVGVEAGVNAGMRVIAGENSDRGEDRERIEELSYAVIRSYKEILPV